MMGIGAKRAAKLKASGPWRRMMSGEARIASAWANARAAGELHDIGGEGGARAAAGRAGCYFGVSFVGQMWSLACFRG